MGSGQTKIQKTCAHIECDPTCKELATDASCEKVIKTPTTCDLPSNTLVSDQKLDLTECNRVTITFKGDGVVRIGLTDKDPSKDKSSLQKSLFEREEGLSHGNSTWTLCKSDFNYICFGPKDMEKEYESDGEVTSAWLYIIYVYGAPNIEANLETASDDSEKISMSWLATDQTKVTENTAVCRIREPVVNGDVYHCHWNMMLQNERIAGKSPTFGYMRFRLVANSEGDNNEEMTVWEHSSAVREYPFSSIIALCVSVRERTVSHNLFVTSVGYTDKSHFTSQQQPKSLQLVVEFSSGELNIDHARKGRIILQDPGSILLVKHYESDDDYTDTGDLLMEVGSKISFKPRRLLFGNSPAIFALELNKRLTTEDIKAIGEQLACDVEKLEETSAVQVIIEGIEVDKFDIEQHFSRENAGGGAIKQMEKDADIPRCWIIKYNEKEVARRIWMAKTHTFTAECRRVNAIVFPIFKGLGMVVNNGEKPIYDMNPLVVVVHKDKLRFIMKRKLEKKDFVEYVKRRITVNIVWPEHTTSAKDKDTEFESEDEDDDDSDDGEPKSITFECHVNKSDGKKLAIWKDITQRAVEEYFKKCIHEMPLQTHDVTVDDAIHALNDLQHDFEFEVKDNKIVLFGSKKNVLTEVAHIAGNPIIVEEDIEEPIDIEIQKYLALDAEGILDDVKKQCPNTSFKVNRKTNAVSLKGPENEVKNGCVQILKLAIDTKSISLQLNVEQQEFLKRGGKKELMERLKKRQTNPNFTIQNENLIVVVYTGRSDDRRRRRDIEAELEHMVRSTCVSIDDTSVHMIGTYMWDQFKRETESKADGPLIISESKDKKNIHIRGTIRTTELGKTEVENYLKRNATAKCKFRVPFEMCEYLKEYPGEEYRDYLTCVKDSNGSFTCELSINAEGSQLDRLKSAINKDINKINIHWFFIKENWIASVMQDLSELQTLSHNEKALLQVDIGDTLAGQGIAAVSVFQKTGTVIQVRQGDITFETTNIIVNVTNGDQKSFDRGLAKCFVQMGGNSIKDELLKEIRKRKDKEEKERLQKIYEKGSDEIDGQPVIEDMSYPDDLETNVFNAGDVIETTPGHLPCMKVLHANGPVWVDGTQSEERKLKELITKLLQQCQDEKLHSIAIPAIGCGAKNYPVDQATNYIIEAVAAFIENTRHLHVKQVLVCDSSKKTVDNLTKSLTSLKSPWFVFNHGRKIQVEVTRKVSSQVPLETMHRPRSTGQRERPTTAGIRWGRPQLHVNIESHPKRPSSPIHQEENEEFSDGLPFNIPISEKLTLHIKKGDLTKQAVNVIVSTTSSFPDLNGEVARAVIKSGGGSIQNECKNIGSINVGEVRSTGPGSLNCDKIYHVVIPTKWDHKTGPEFVRQMVTLCLREAMTSNYTKVAFPVVGAGKTGFPTDKVANLMIQAICEVGKKNSSLTDVTIVVYSMAGGVAKVFEEVVPQVFKAYHKENGRQQKVSTSGKAAGGYKKRTIARYVQPPSFDKHSIADDVAIIRVISTIRPGDIQKRIEGVIKDQYLSKEMPYKELSDEQTLNESEESRLRLLKNKHGIHIEIDNRKKCVKLSGLKKRVKQCEIVVIKLLRDEFPARRLREKQVKAISSSFQWHYKDDTGTLNAIDPESNYDIHTRYLKGHDFNYMNATEKKEYHVSLSDMTENPVKEPTKKRHLYLKTTVDKDIAVPDTWTISELDKDSAEVKLKEGTPEFNQVEDKFIKDGCPDKQIISITRLEHRYMWLQYQTKKEQLEQQNPQSNNERLLWHGTNIVTIPKIIKNGYDRSFAGNANMTAHGKGVYFAARSSYSNSDLYAARDANGVKRMFLNRVLTGVYVRGHQNMATLPQRPGIEVNKFPVCYDSSVDNDKHPAIFVIFHDTQAYPEYLIEYTA